MLETWRVTTIPVQNPALDCFDVPTHPKVLFPVSAPDVKKRLESLIERDYLEREEGSGASYRYLA